MTKSLYKCKSKTKTWSVVPSIGIEVGYTFPPPSHPLHLKYFSPSLSHCGS